MTRYREPFNGFSHLFGAAVAALGSIGMIALGLAKGIEITPLVVYGSSLVLLFSASAAYHLSHGKIIPLLILQKLDHSAIYLLIAGTYTPFCLLAFNGFYNWGLMAIIWSVALAGILTKFLPIQTPRWLNALFYVIMGWMCIIAVPQMMVTLSPATLLCLVAGGLLYTLGAVIYAARLFNFQPGRFGFHEVWHIFVLLGAVTQFASILMMISRIPIV